MAKMNPSFKKSTTTVMKVEGIYEGECMILDEDEGMELDLMALLQGFKGQYIKVTVKQVDEEGDE